MADLTSVIQPDKDKVDLDTNLAGATEDEQIRSLILSNKSDCQNYRTTSLILEDLKTWYDLYMAIPKPKPYTWMSNVFIPITSAKVDTGVSNIMEMTLKTAEPVYVKPRAFGNGDDHHAAIIKALINKQLKNDDFFYKFLQFVKGLLIYGTMIGKVCWDSKPRNLKIKEKQYNNILDIFGNIVKKVFNGYEPKPAYEDIGDGPIFDVCNLGDIDHDPQSIEIRDGWVQHNLLRDLDYLQSRVKTKDNENGIYNENVMKLTAKDGTEYNEGKWNIEQSNAKSQNPVVARPSGNVKIKIIERVGYFKLNGKYQPCILTLAADKYVIRKEEFPYWMEEGTNYVKGVYIPLINEFYGIGVPQLSEDIQNNFNENINQRIDNISLALNPMAKYTKNSGINTQGLVWKPGGTYGIEEGGDLTWDRPPDVTNSNFAHTQELERWHQEVTAITKITLGTGGTDINRTATGMSILQKSASDRFLITAKIIEYTAFAKIAQKFYELDYQFYDEYKIAAILGIDPSEIDMSKMAPHYYDFVPDGVRTMEDKTSKALKLLQAMTIGKDIPDFDMRKAFIKFINLLEISDNPEKELLRSPEQAMALRQAEAIKMQMMLLAKGGGGSVPTGAGSEGTQFSGMVQGNAPGVPPVGQGAMPPPEA